MSARLQSMIRVQGSYERKVFCRSCVGIALSVNMVAFDGLAPTAHVGATSNEHESRGGNILAISSGCKSWLPAMIAGYWGTGVVSKERQPPGSKEELCDSCLSAADVG